MIEALKSKDDITIKSIISYLMMLLFGPITIVSVILIVLYDPFVPSKDFVIFRFKTRR